MYAAVKDVINMQITRHLLLELHHAVSVTQRSAGCPVAAVGAGQGRGCTVGSNTPALEVGSKAFVLLDEGPLIFPPPVRLHT